MSKTRFLGNIIKTNPTIPTTSAASGVWTLEEAGSFRAAGDWPIPFDGSVGRGLFAGGYGSNAYSNVIDFINIESTGNASDFGNLSDTPYEPGALASRTRAVFGGGENASYARLNVMEYVTIASEGDVTDFGDLIQVNRSPAGSANDTRGLFSTGMTSSNVKLNVIQYITIENTGNATDFGDWNALAASASA